MRDYEIDEAIESLMADMDYYDYDDYAAESLDRLVINTAMTVGTLLHPTTNILAQLMDVPIAMISAANIRAITKDVIKEGDPEQIRNAIKAIKARVRYYDNHTDYI